MPARQAIDLAHPTLRLEIVGAIPIQLELRAAAGDVRPVHLSREGHQAEPARASVEGRLVVQAVEDRLVVDGIARREDEAVARIADLVLPEPAGVDHLLRELPGIASVRTEAGLRPVVHNALQGAKLERVFAGQEMTVDFGHALWVDIAVPRQIRRVDRVALFASDKDPVGVGLIGKISARQVQAVVVAAILERLVAGIRGRRGLEGETRAPALLQHGVAIEAEAKPFARAFVGDGAVLRRLGFHLMAEAEMARKLELAQRRVEVEFSRRGVGGELLDQFGSKLLGFLVVNNSFADKKVDQRTAILGH